MAVKLIVAYDDRRRIGRAGELTQERRADGCRIYGDIRCPGNCFAPDFSM